jgi:hypothetical protein
VLEDLPEGQHVGRGLRVPGNADVVLEHQLLKPIDDVGCKFDCNVHEVFLIDYALRSSSGSVDPSPIGVNLPYDNVLYHMQD